MTKRNLIIVIILLSVIDLVAAGWYMSRRIEASGKSQNLFEQRDSTEVIAMADTVTNASQADVFDKEQHNTYYFIANTPSISGNNSSRYASIKHVKVRWPKKINGDDELTELNKELISKAFGNSHSSLKDARYVYLNTPSFNKPIGDDYKKLTSAPTIVPVYGNVSQVLVYPYMTSQRLLVMEIDKVEYDGRNTSEENFFIHYDRQRQRVMSRLDILVAEAGKENELLKVINKKIDEINKGRSKGQLQHALNVPAEICCTKKGILFQYKHGSISSEPVEILIDNSKLEPFFTEDYKQMQEHNEGYHIYSDKVKPEPINPRSAVNTQPKPQVKSQSKHHYNKSYHKSSRSHYYYNGSKNDTNASKKQYFKPRYKSKRKYSGARHKSGYRSYSGKRHWSHRRR